MKTNNDEFERILQKKLQQARDEWSTLPPEEKAKWTQKELLGLELAVLESVHQKWINEVAAFQKGPSELGPLDPRVPYLQQPKRRPRKLPKR